MRIAKLDTSDGPPWWVVVHELTVLEARYKSFRPITAFTLLAQTLVTEQKERMFRLCMTLENKLTGTIHHHASLYSALKNVSPLDKSTKFIQKYDDNERVIFELEAYLNTIYSTLEIVSQINRLLDDTLPIGFRKQDKKLNHFDKHPWLKEYYDLRSELTHFNTLLPIVSQDKILIEFTMPKKLLHFTRGIQELSFSSILGYLNSLWDMLDQWAIVELEKVDPNTEIDSISEPTNGKPIRTKKIMASEILNGLR